MSDPQVSNEPLILDMLQWIAAEQRSYADVMDAWRTSCPRLTIWEDAVDRDLVERQGGIVSVTPKGQIELLKRRA